MNLLEKGLQTVTSQCRNIGKPVKVIKSINKRQSLLLVDNSLIQLVIEDNVVKRGAPSNATWRMENLIESDLVVVFYGPAINPGAIWNESKGNPFKDDYRRIGYTKNIKTSVTGYAEIRTIFTEANLKRGLLGKRFR